MDTGPAIDFRSFLESIPPLEPRLVTITVTAVGRSPRIDVPPIYLYCTGEDCRGVRYYDFVGSDMYVPDSDRRREDFLWFRCRNCESVSKTYAVRMTNSEHSHLILTMVKLGEMPRFGEPRPNLVTDLLDDEVEYFERGYRAETYGLGIGAFAYYRRFVESHKDKIISEIRKVAVEQNLLPSIIQGLDRAAAKREFSAAVEEIKDAIPDGLKINGMNPLTLLHNALSSGLHSDDDVVCLEIAQDIRTVLTALADRTSALLKTESGFKAAVTRLNQRNAGQKPKGP
jgi:hypothetical protein